MDQDRISIITPFWNAESTLAVCIESVLLQTWADWELLLVDDGSDDGSPDIADSYAETDPRIRVIHTENRGVSTARNEGLKMASGEFATFLDADDRMAPEMLKTLYAVLQKTGADIAGCGFHTFTDWGRMSPEEREPGDAEQEESAAPEETEGKAPAVETVTAEEFVRNRLLFSDTRIWSKLFRKNILGGASFRNDLTIGEDMLFLLSLMEDAHSIAITDEKLYYYYVNPKGAMEKPFEKSYMDQILCWDTAAHWIGGHMPEILQDEASAAQLAAVQCVSVMLVAGKLARLSPEQRKNFQKETEQAGARLKEYLKVKGVYAALPAGYRIKTSMFSRFPQFYFKSYGAYKSVT